MRDVRPWAVDEDRPRAERVPACLLELHEHGLLDQRPTSELSAFRGGGFDGAVTDRCLDFDHSDGPYADIGNLRSLDVYAWRRPGSWREGRICRAKRRANSASTSHDRGAREEREHAMIGVAHGRCRIIGRGCEPDRLPAAGASWITPVTDPVPLARQPNRNRRCLVRTQTYPALRYPPMNVLAPHLGIVLALVGCGGHSMTEPSSIPIDPITFDAVYVVNGEDNSITVIDATTDEVAGTIELVDVDYPHHIYASPDRATLLVAVPGADLSGGHSGGGGHGGGHGGGAVLALDAATGALRTSRSLDAPNHNAIYAPDGGTVWTSQMTTPGEVLILDASTLATRRAITVGDGPAEITFAPSGAYAFIANTASNTVSVLGPSGELVGTVPVGAAPVGAWPGTDGRMYVDNETGKSISVIDPATQSVVATHALGFTPALAAVAPNGELWVTDTDNGKLVFLDATTGAKRGELATGAGAHAFAFSSNGAKAYVTNQLAGSVSVVDTTTRTLVKTITVGAKPNGILFRELIR